MSGDLRAELARWGVVFLPARRAALRSVGFTTDGELSELRTVRAVRQIGSTPDTLFQADLVSDGDNLWKVILTGFVSANPIFTERNALLLSVGLSVGLPWWDERTRWLVEGLRTLKGGDCSPVAWPGAFAVSLHHTPLPVNAVHLTIVYRGRRPSRA